MSLETSAVFFVARTGSTRLERKVLLPMAGKPLIVHHFDRMRLAKFPNKLVLCTTVSGEDDELAELAASEGLEVFRGSETDVPGRLLNACREFEVDQFVLCEADEHFSDPMHVDALLSRTGEKRDDWVHIVGNPIGAWIRKVSRFSMESLCSDMETDNLSGWGLYFDKFPERFNLAEIQVMSDEDAMFNEEVRLTIDYPEDFELATELYARLYTDGNPIRLQDVVDELKRDPSLLALNAHRQDSYEANIKSQSAGIIE